MPIKNNIRPGDYVVIEIGRTMCREGFPILRISKHTDKMFAEAYVYPVELIHEGKVKIPASTLGVLFEQLEQEELKHAAKEG